MHKEGLENNDLIKIFIRQDRKTEITIIGL